MGSAKTGHNWTSLNFQYIALNKLGGLPVQYKKFHKFFEHFFLSEGKGLIMKTWVQESLKIFVLLHQDAQVMGAC